MAVAILVSMAFDVAVLMIKEYETNDDYTDREGKHMGQRA